LVINAANNFTVDKDGRVVASDADISGHIIATSGQIGGLEIASELETENKTTSLTVPSDHNFSINFV
jgi:hypothetical protein